MLKVRNSAHKRDISGSARYVVFVLNCVLGSSRQLLFPLPIKASRAVKVHCQRL